MNLTLYQVDAFAEHVFAGNPAAVCPLGEWLADDLLLKIAAENNLSETAFYVPKDKGIEIRWFTPTVEVDLCGHATLATAFVLDQFEKHTGSTINFYSPRSGHLPVAVRDGAYVLNFPVDHVAAIPLTEELIAATDKTPKAAYRGKTDYMLVFEEEDDIEAMRPNLSAIAQLKARGVIVTAPSRNYDFVSRFFAPVVGIDEDPVCGSAHTTLIPFWADQLHKEELKAFQCSARGGELHGHMLGDRVELGGKAVLYMKGEIYI